MSCNIKLKNYNNVEMESQLFPQIFSILENNPHYVLMSTDDSINTIDELTDDHLIEVAKKTYAFFESEEFKDKFKNWQNVDLKSTNAVHEDTNEPKLFKDDNGRWFFFNKFKDKTYYPFINNGLEYIFSNDEINEGVNSLAYSFFIKNFNEDYDNLSFMTKSSLEEFVDEYINDKIDILESNNYEENANNLRDSLNYKNEWIKGVALFFDQIGLNIEDDLEIEDEENQTKNYSQESSEIDPKTKVVKNIKIILSLLPDTENEISSVFADYKFLSFNKVYNLLSTNLTDLAPTITKDGVEDVYKLMKSKIETLAIRHPYLNELIKVLNNPKFEEYKEQQFFNAFNLSKRNYLTTEVDYNKKQIKSKVIDISETSSKGSSIYRIWFSNFTSNFINKVPLVNKKTGKKVRDTFEFNTSKLRNVYLKIDTLKNKISTNRSFILKNKESQEAMDTIENRLSDIVEILNDLGIVTTQDSFTSYVTENYENISDILGFIIKTSNSLDKVVSDYGKNLDNNLKVDKKSYSLENIFETESFFKDLAKMEAEFLSDEFDSSVFSAGKTYWKFTLPSHLSMLINSWKRNIKELEEVYKEQGSESSEFLKYLLGHDQKWNSEKARIQEATKRIDKLKLYTFNVLQSKVTSNTKGNAQNSTEIAKTDMIADNMNKVLQSILGKNKQSIYSTPTPADKATLYQLGINYFKKSGYEYNNGDEKISSEIKEIFFNYIKSNFDIMKKELSKIKEGTADKIVHYNTNKNGDFIVNNKLVGNVFKLSLFPGLNNTKFYKDAFNPTTNEPLSINIDDYNNEITSYIEKSITSNIKDLYDRLLFVENLFEVNDKNELVNKSIDDNIFKYYKDNYSSPTRTLIADYYINSVISNIEYSKLFSKNPAFYKNMPDYIKRIPFTYTDGITLNIRKQEDLFFNISIIQDIEIASPYIDNLIKISKLHKTGEVIKKGDILDSKNNIPYPDRYVGVPKNRVNSILAYDKIDGTQYNGNNTADAQSWITPNRWKFILQKSGLWKGDLHKNAYEKMMSINKEPYSSNELKVLAQPLKGTYFRSNKGIPIGLKFSEAVLIPNLIGNNSGLKKLYDKMIKSNIDQVVTMSGIKVGAQNPTKIHNETGNIIDNFELNSIQLDNRGYKIQQNLPTKLFKETALGTQLQKNAYEGLHNNLDKIFTLNDKDVTGNELYKSLNKVIGVLLDLGETALTQELGLNNNKQITNVKSLYNLLLNEARRKGVNNNILEALEKEMNIYGIPQYHETLMNTFFSMIKNRILKLKTNGGSMIQTSNFGLDALSQKEKDGIKWFIDPTKHLKIASVEEVEIKDKEGNTKIVNKIKPGQILLPGSMIAKYIPNWKELSSDQLKKMIDPKILENIIGYRIPNQGLSSTDALEIVGFLPEGMGDAVVAYSEIPTKTGSDFDIDKLYMMIPSIQPKYTKIFNSTLTKYGLTNKIAEDILKKEGFKLPTFSDASILLYELYESDQLTNNNIELREFFKGVDSLKQKVEKVNYAKPKFDKNNIELPLDQQPKEVVQNMLIEHYKAIFTNEHVINDIITPLDFPFIKDYIVEMFPDNNDGDLYYYDPIKNIDIKYEFIAGKAGVGQGANALVDHIRGLFANVKFNNYFIEAGHIDKQGTLLDQKFSKELSKSDLNYISKRLGLPKENIVKYKISNSISAILNAFVDIAKDPYITRANWNTFTSNTGFALIRSGVHPYIVNSFLSQPMIKKYYDFVQSKESKITSDTGDLYSKFQEQLLNEKLIDNKITIGNITITYLDAYSIMKRSKKEPTFKALINLFKGQYSKDINEEYLKEEFNKLSEMVSNNKSTFKDKNIDTNFSLQKLEEAIFNKGEDVEFQVSMLKTFQSLQKVASKKLKGGIDMAKMDVNGPGKNLSTFIRIKNQIRQVMQESKTPEIGSLLNINSKLKDENNDNTMLGHFLDKMEIIQDIVKNNQNIFLTGNENVANTFNTISTQLYGNSLQNDTLSNLLNKDFYAYILSNFNKFNLDNSTPHDLFSNLPDDIESLKKTDDNFLLENLEISKYEGDYRFIQFKLKTKDPLVQNKLHKAWKDLMYDHPQVAEDLIRYSFYQSGFQNNINTFHTYIPHEFFIEHDLNFYISSIAKSLNGLQNQFIDQFYRNNSENGLVVPNIFSKMVKPLQAGITYKLDNLKFQENRKKENFDDKKDGLPQFVTYNFTNKLPSGQSVRGKMFLKLVGYDGEFNGIYAKTYKLGLKGKEGNIFEYTFGETKLSSIETNNLPNIKLQKNIVNKTLKKEIVYNHNYFTSIKANTLVPIKKENNFNNLQNSNILKFTKETKENNPLDKCN